MYFPYLRGRQFELIALREVCEMELLCNKILPIIEPVKASSTLNSTIAQFCDKIQRIGIIHNPQVGSFYKELADEKKVKIRETYESIFSNDDLVKIHILNDKSKKEIAELQENGIDKDSLIVVCKDRSYIDLYNSIFSDQQPLYNIIPDESAFRRKIRNSKVMLSDRYNKQKRNVDYKDIPDEFFSDDHLFFAEDGYKGFSDYSIIGDDYQDSGFAPYAVVIHIVYFADDETLRIKHFVSETNFDTTDPAGKFGEALKKLVKWNTDIGLKTYGIKQFEELYKAGKYPGLGTVKKLSIMHHLELISDYMKESAG